MKNAFIRLLSAVLALTLCFMLPAGLAEDTAEAPVGAAAETSPDDVMALVNGEAITRATFEEYQASIYNYLLYLQMYDSSFYMSEADLLAVANSIALDYAVQDTLVGQKYIDLGLSLTEEERQQAEADGASEWADTVAYYMAYDYGITAESTEAETAEARLNALAMLESYGYTESGYIESVISDLENEKIYAYMVQGAEVTEADIQAAFNERVAADRERYENDIAQYEWNEQIAQYYSDYYNAEPSYYTPAGYRGVLQILLEVDEALMGEWQSLTARLEEQLEEVDAEDAAEETTATDLPEAPVTQEQVDAAYAAIIASVQPTIDEIMRKFESGTPFADLVAEYGTDPGMTEEPNKSNGYSVHLDSVFLDPAFVAGAFSVDEIGAVAEPVVGSYGVYIIQYIRDVPSGAVELTDEIRGALTAQVLESKESELYQATLEGWLAEAEIVYSEEAQAIIAVNADEE